MSSDLTTGWEESEFVLLSVKSQAQTYCCIEHHCQLSPPKQMQNLFSEPNESLLQPLITRETVSSLHLSHSLHLHLMSQPQRELKLHGDLHHLWKMETSFMWISALASSLQNPTQKQTEPSLNSAHWFTQTSTVELTFDFCLLPTNCILLQSGREAAFHLQPFIPQKDPYDFLGNRFADTGSKFHCFWLNDPCLWECLQTKPSPFNLACTTDMKGCTKGSRDATHIPPPGSLALISLFTVLTHFYHTSRALHYHHLLQSPQLWEIPSPAKEVEHALLTVSTWINQSFACFLKGFKGLLGNSTGLEPGLLCFLLQQSVVRAPFKPLELLWSRPIHLSQTDNKQEERNQKL